jgi:Ca2+-binding RTX toxin-like protein
MPGFLNCFFPNIQIGTMGDDRIAGANGQDWIFGLEGNDILNGNAGSDVLDGGAGIDWVPYVYDQIAGGNQGVYVDLASGWAKDAFGSYDRLYNIENIGGTDNPYPGVAGLSDVLLGNDFNNAIVGGAGTDYIDGRGGSDTLVGGLGNDSLFGGLGTDNFLLNYDLEAGATDYIGDFQANDTISFPSSFAAPGSISFADASISVPLNNGVYTVAVPGATAAQLIASTIFLG